MDVFFLLYVFCEPHYPLKGQNCFISMKSMTNNFNSPNDCLHQKNCFQIQILKLKKLTFTSCCEVVNNVNFAKFCFQR